MPDHDFSDPEKELRRFGVESYAKAERENAGAKLATIATEATYAERDMLSDAYRAACAEIARRDNAEVECPFCKDDGFDLIGLKIHYAAGHCLPFNETTLP